MGSDQENIVVMCQHPGVLLNYSALLNCLGYFKVVLCSNMKEVRRALRNLPSVDFFCWMILKLEVLMRSIL